MDERPEDEIGPVLVPLEQDTLDFYGKPLVVVRLPNGEPGVALNHLCENIGLDRRSQLRRVQQTKALAAGLASMRIATPGGPQVVNVLTLKVTPAWLFTIDAARAKPEIRPEIERYQAECVDVLYQHFAHKALPALPEPRSVIVQPIADPGPAASHEERATYHETMSLWHRWQADYHNQEWRREIRGKQEAIVEEQKGMGGLVSNVQKRLGPERITTEHQGLIRYYVSRLSDATGKARGTIFASLHTAFRVPRYQELLEADWPAIEEFFKRRFPGRVLPVVQQSFDFDALEE